MTGKICHRSPKWYGFSCILSSLSGKLTGAEETRLVRLSCAWNMLPLNSHVEILALKMMVVEDGALGGDWVIKMDPHK